MLCGLGLLRAATTVRTQEAVWIFGRERTWLPSGCSLLALTLASEKNTAAQTQHFRGVVRHWKGTGLVPEGAHASYDCYDKRVDYLAKCLDETL
eukprot:4353648-Pyramimonas_sp.AAC.1